tara:strand:+ start:99 stop:386 length:288 start_codon:yes stop_codon:yes gene_type:complete
MFVKKFSSLLIITIFLSMQVFLLLHTTEYGFEKHGHNGQVCDIYLNADHNTLLNNDPTKLTTLNLLTFKTSLPKEILLFSGKVKLFNPRAPPFFS